MKTSLKDNRFVTKLACIAGVRQTEPNFKPQCRADEVVMTTQELNVRT